MKPLSHAIAGLFAATALFSAAPQAQERADAPPAYQSQRSATYGVIESIDVVRSGNDGSAVAGTILGGVLGGVLGHQIGSGRGNDVATVAGALGGAAVGHEIAEGRGGRDGVRIRVRTDNGDDQVIEQDNANGLVVGDRVRVDGGRLSVVASDNRRPDYQSLRRDDRGNRYDGQGYRIDDRGDRFDSEGYRVDERGVRY